MYEEIYEYCSIQDWVKLKSPQHRTTRGQWCQADNKYRVSVYGFQCCHCQAYVSTHPIISGVQNRNHCPYCLRSRHVDYSRAGDRMSACKAIMQPIGLTVKRRRNKYREEMFGELMLVHRCNDCGKLSINRLAADDQVDRLMELYQTSLSLDVSTSDMIETMGIHLLLADDVRLVVSQLCGKGQI